MFHCVYMCMGVCVPQFYSYYRQLFVCSILSDVLIISVLADQGDSPKVHKSA